TLRYPYEVRKPEQYFGDIAQERIPKDMLELASHIVATKAGHFEPTTFEDHYENALKDLIRKKQSGKPIEHAERREPAKVINLMDALRKSVAAESGTPRRKAPSRRRPGHPRRVGTKRTRGSRLSDQHRG